MIWLMENDNPLSPILQLIQKGEYLKAYGRLNAEKEECFRLFPKRTLSLLYELSMALNDPKGGAESIRGLAELPYVDQETEEMLRDLPKRLSGAKGSEEETLEGVLPLLSPDSSKTDVKRALSYCLSHPLAYPSFRQRLREFVSSDASEELRKAALQLLSRFGDDEPVMASFGGKSGQWVPSSLPSAATARAIEGALKEIEASPDRGIASAAADILFAYANARYPFPVEESNLAEGCLELSAAYLGKGEKGELSLSIEKAIYPKKPA